MNLPLLHHFKYVWRTLVKLGKKTLGNLPGGFLETADFIQLFARFGKAPLGPELVHGQAQLRRHCAQGLALPLNAGMNLAHTIKLKPLGRGCHSLGNAIEAVPDLEDVLAVEWGDERCIQPSQDLARQSVRYVTVLLNISRQRAGVR